MRFFSSKLVSATSSSSLLELWCRSILCPTAGGLKPTVILPQALADGWGPCWALWVLLSPSPSGHAGRAPMQPWASRGWANAAAELWSMGLVWPDEHQSCDLPVSWGTSQGRKWDVMVEFLRLRCHFQKNVQVSSWISICACTVGKAAPENCLVKSCRAGQNHHAACCVFPNCAGHVPSSDVYGGFLLRAESLHLCFQFKFSHKSEQKACKVQHLPNCPI